MSKTYRALGIAAIAMLLALALHGVYLYWWDLRDFNASQPPDLTLGYFVVFWTQTVILFAPIISTFSLIVAAQSRDRAWIIIFLVAGIIGSYGATIDFLLPQGINNLLLFLFQRLVPPQNSAPPALSIAMDITQQVIVKLVPALAALIYVGLKLRAGAPTRGTTAIAAQA